MREGYFVYQENRSRRAHLRPKQLSTHSHWIYRHTNGYLAAGFLLLLLLLLLSALLLLLLALDVLLVLPVELSKGSNSA